MNADETHYPMPRRLHTDSDEVRRIGVELELSGLTLDQLSAVVRNFLAGELQRDGRYEHRILGDEAGVWRAELDHTYLKRKGRKPRDPDNPLSALDEATEEMLRRGVELVMPMEVVSPPLPMTRLHELDRLVTMLRDAGARGTTDGLVYAFGVHLNPELPSTDIDCVRRYLKAFLCLYEWLKQQSRVDFLRRMTTFIDPFPMQYVKMVIDPGYRPDQAQLIDDYIHYNHTRNRALDMLPLFAYLDEQRVRRQIDDPRIKGRPTLHYRLPNSEIDVPGWTIEQAWRDWLQVEALAADSERLDAMCGHYQQFLQRPLGWLVDDWAEQVPAWLSELSDH